MVKRSGTDRDGTGRDGPDRGDSLYPSPVIGHRGACALAPENTLASFRQAASDGVAMVECDVVLTVDDRPVLFHDDTLERTTDGLGTVAATSLAALGALDAGVWFGSAFAGTPVPTLEEALETTLDLGLALNLEIKPSPERDADTARIALATAQGLWPADRPPPVISSFSREALAVARDIAPDWPRALLSPDIPGDWTEAALILGLKALHMADSHACAASLRKVLAGGYEVAVYTVDNPERARNLWRWGASAVFADDPGALLKAIR